MVWKRIPLCLRPANKEQLFSSPLSLVKEGGIRCMPLPGEALSSEEI